MEGKNVAVEELSGQLEPTRKPRGKSREKEHQQPSGGHIAQKGERESWGEKTGRTSGGNKKKTKKKKKKKSHKQHAQSVLVRQREEKSKTLVVRPDVGVRIWGGETA